jgi:hypothetical protein
MAEAERSSVARRLAAIIGTVNRSTAEMGWRMKPPGPVRPRSRMASRTAAASPATTGKNRSITARVTAIGRGTFEDRRAVLRSTGEVVAIRCMPTPAVTVNRMR